jgi:hypothetical protein
MRLDVGEPGVERAGDANVGALVAGQMRGPHRAHLAQVALQQPLVQVRLRLEVVVDHRGRDARAPRDLVDRRRLIAALGEHLRRRRLDHGAALRGAHPGPGRHT